MTTRAYFRWRLTGTADPAEAEARLRRLAAPRTTAGGLAAEAQANAAAPDAASRHTDARGAETVAGGGGDRLAAAAGQDGHPGVGPDPFGAPSAGVSDESGRSTPADDNPPQVKPRLAPDGHHGAGGRYGEPDGHPASGPAHSSAADNMEVPDETEVWLRRHLGDAKYEELWYGSAEAMAERMDLDLDQVEAAGPLAIAAMAGVTAFRHLNPQSEREVNKAVVALAEAGHVELANELLGRLAIQRSLGPDFERYSMTNAELRAANEADRKALLFFKAVDAISGRVPGATLFGRNLGAIFVRGLERNIAERKAIMDKRRQSPDESQ